MLEYVSDQMDDLWDDLNAEADAALSVEAAVLLRNAAINVLQVRECVRRAIDAENRRFEGRGVA